MVRVRCSVYDYAGRCFGNYGTMSRPAVKLDWADRKARSILRDVMATPSATIIAELIAAALRDEIEACAVIAKGTHTKDLLCKCSGCKAAAKMRERMP